MVIIHLYNTNNALKYLNELYKYYQVEQITPKIGNGNQGNI